MGWPNPDTQHEHPIMNFPRQRIFWAVSVGHLTNDIFMSLGPVLLAFLSAHLLPMTNIEIGAAVSAQQLVGAVSQPLFGWLIDRGGERWERWFGAGGVLWTVGFLLLAVILAGTGQFWLMIVPFGLAAVGSGAFHPVGTKLAAESVPQRAASQLSYFFLMGQGGLALGPAVAGLLLDAANPAGSNGTTLTPLFALGLAAIPAIGFLGTSLGRPRTELNTAAPAAESPQTSPARAAIPVKALALLGVMVALRSLAQPGSVTFIPRLFQLKGWDATEYGLITSSFWIASGIAGILFGQLADRFDRRWVIAISLMLSVPALFLLPVTDGKPLAFGLAIAAGGLTGGSHSVIVALAQSLIPGRKGFASGATLGFLFGAGALGGLVIGGLSDQIGLEPAFQIIAGTTALAALLALALPASEPADAADEVPLDLEADPTRAR
jgi:FSR family fosmidomycin resistance protein-like MFS transporter